MINRRALVIAAAGVSLCAASVAAVQAQEWPSRAITLVAPYTPGTGADILARLLGPRLSEKWKVPVVTENRVGAAGTIGADYVAKAAPDGYTLLFTATSYGTNPALQANIAFDPLKSLIPVSLLASGALCVVVNPQTGAATMPQFIDLVKRSPGKLNYSSPGIGGPQHLAMELIKLETGINIVHVPYKEASRAVSDVVAGQVQAMASSLQTVAPMVTAGKLRMVGVMAPERQRAFPDVPTFREQGLANLEVETWYGVLAPAGTPPAIVQKLNAELNEALKVAQVREVLAKQGLDAVGGPPERFGQLIAREIPRWKRVVAAAGIKPE